MRRVVPSVVLAIWLIIGAGCTTSAQVALPAPTTTPAPTPTPTATPEPTVVPVSQIDVWCETEAVNVQIALFTIGSPLQREPEQLQANFDELQRRLEVASTSVPIELELTLDGSIETVVELIAVMDRFAWDLDAAIESGSLDRVDGMFEQATRTLDSFNVANCELPSALSLEDESLAFYAEDLPPVPFPPPDQLVQWDDFEEGAPREFDTEAALQEFVAAGMTQAEAECVVKLMLEEFDPGISIFELCGISLERLDELIELDTAPDRRERDGDADSDN